MRPSAVGLAWPGVSCGAPGVGYATRYVQVASVSCPAASRAVTRAVNVPAALVSSGTLPEAGVTRPLPPSPAVKVADALSPARTVEDGQTRSTVGGVLSTT